jgi:hypothetical protein
VRRKNIGTISYDIPFRALFQTFKFRLLRPLLSILLVSFSFFLSCLFLFLSFSLLILSFSDFVSVHCYLSVFPLLELSFFLFLFFLSFWKMYFIQIYPYLSASDFFFHFLSSFYLHFIYICCSVSVLSLFFFFLFSQSPICLSLRIVMIRRLDSSSLLSYCIDAIFSSQFTICFGRYVLIDNLTENTFQETSSQKQI